MRPTVQVTHGDALAWLADRPRTPGASLLVGLPDMAETSAALADWQVFFAKAARLCLDAVDEQGLAVFLHTDKRIEDRWVSKAMIVMQAAEAAGSTLLFHKIVCRKPPGTLMMGRPSYSHLMAFSVAARLPAARSTPDVLVDAGEPAWSHGMGPRAAAFAVSNIRALSPTTTLLLAPFCGLGEALVAARSQGLDAHGCELNRKRSERARARALGLEGRVTAGAEVEEG